MKKLLVSYVLFILITTPTVLADSSITMETIINESLHVTFNFTDIEPQLYDEIKAQGFNVTTIPNILEEKFRQQNLTNARVIYNLNQEIFDNATRSIYVKLILAGSDIISYTLNKTDMTRTFSVKAEWRKFEISFTKNFSINFEEHFGVPLTKWQQVNHTTTDGKIHPAIERTIESPFEMSFRLILPEKAFNIQVEENTIIFKVPPVFEDTLLNSPFLILGAIIIANVIAVIYRKTKK